MIDSFGIKLLTCKIPPPKLARAIGVHLSTLENAMHDNNPSEEMLERLEKVSSADDWHYGHKLKVAEMKWWVSAYDAAKKEDRRTVTTRDWVIRSPLLTLLAPVDISIGMMAWAHGAESFSWDVVRKVFPFNDDEMLSMQLASLRFSNQQENVGGKVHSLWRWNPLNLEVQIGRPPNSKLVAPIQRNIKDLIFQDLVEKARKLLTPASSCTFDEFCKYMNVFPKTNNAAQRFRRVLSDLNWEYDKSTKRWNRTARFLPSIT